MGSSVKSIIGTAAPIVGAMSGVPGGAQIGAMVGGAIAGKRQERQAGESAAQYNARMQQLGQKAFFRPVDVTTLYGQSQFEIDPSTGALKSAGYTASPEVIERQRRFGSLMDEGLTAAERASGYLPQFEEAAQRSLQLGQQFLPSSTTGQITPAEQEYLSTLQTLGRGLTSDLSTTPSEDALQQQTRLRGFAEQLEPTTGAQLTQAEQDYLARTGGAAEDILGGMSTQAASDVARQRQKLLGQEQRLEQLAGQVTPTAYDPTTAARSYYEEQQALMEPTRMREEQRLASGLFGRGRGGLSVGAEGQPELFALAQARREQDARLAAESRLRGRQEQREDIGLGTQLGEQALTAGQTALTEAQRGRQEQLGLTSTGLDFMSQQQAAEEAARQRRLQEMGLSAEFGGAGVTAGQQGQQFRLGQLGQGIDLLSAALTPEERARQRMFQDIEAGNKLTAQAGGLFGTGYDVMQGSLAPYQSYLAGQARLEELAQQPLTMGANLGATAMSGSQFGAKMGALGAGEIADQQIAANQRQAALMEGFLGNTKLQGDIGSAIKTGIGKIGGLFNGGVPGFGGGSFGGGQAVPYSSGMSTPGLMFGQRSY